MLRLISRRCSPFSNQRVKKLDVPSSQPRQDRTGQDRTELLPVSRSLPVGCLQIGALSGQRSRPDQPPIAFPFLWLLIAHRSSGAISSNLVGNLAGLTPQRLVCRFCLLRHLLNHAITSSRSERAVCVQSVSQMSLTSSRKHDVGISPSNVPLQLFLLFAAVAMFSAALFVWWLRFSSP